jgi:hypothetical protein
MRYLFIYIFLIQSAILFGQPFESIFSDSTRWNVYELVPDAGWTNVYYSSSDTTIDELMYHKLYRGYIYSPDQEVISESSFVGYVHEDTLSGKYWFLKDTESGLMKALFMDFSLEQGDSMAIIWDFRFMFTLKIIER